MKGFFDREEVEQVKVKKKTVSKRKKSTTKKVLDLCEKCGLYKDCTTPKMSYTGQGKKKILIIGDSPKKNEDVRGMNFLGASGKLLRESLDAINIDLDKDCYKTNALICYSKNNKEPTSAQIKYCRKNLFKTIDELKPEKILCLGKTALQSLIGLKYNVTSISKWLRWIIPDQDLKCFISVNYHPSYLTENNDDIILHREFENNLIDFFNYDKKFKSLNTHYSLFTYEHVEVLDRLSKIQHNDVICFDYETTGLKPFHDDHKILCVSVSLYNSVYSDGIKNSFCFNLENENVKNKWIEILQNPKIKKIAQNCKFEHLWTKQILKCDIQGWLWDTMLATHILDNRSGVSGLKFQTYVNFGIIGYEDEVKKYISADENGFNKLNDLDKTVLYKYCVLDSIYTNLLYQKQKQILKNKEAHDFFLKGTIALANVEYNGWSVDYPHFEKSKKRLDIKLKIIQDSIKKTKAFNLWEEIKKEELNINSSKQLRELFFDIMKLKSPKKTEKGVDSVDVDVLSGMNNKIAKLIVEDRKIRKIKKTYVENFMSEVNSDNRIHPFYNLGTVQSFRSSSSNPNMQNCPKRNEKAGKIIRSGIIPSKNNYLLEVDYSGLEVHISACYHKDPKMIKYLQGHGDMHKDSASDLLELDKRQVTKDQRYVAKNKFVFPQFYGSWYRECAKNIWESIDEETKQHLIDCGFTTLKKYENHVEDVEYNFWNKRFKVYNKWKKDTWNEYLDKGFIRSKTGFVYSGIMRKNEVLNYPIQGSAFHCLLWSLITLNKWLRDNKMKSKIIGQIHDSLILEIHKNELNILKPKIKYIMTEQIREEWNWIIIPLKVEAEISDKNWNDMKELIL